jgi:hypothetical protein
MRAPPPDDEAEAEEAEEVAEAAEAAEAAEVEGVERLPRPPVALLPLFPLVPLLPLLPPPPPLPLLLLLLLLLLPPPPMPTELPTADTKSALKATRHHGSVDHCSYGLFARGGVGVGAMGGRGDGGAAAARGDVREVEVSVLGRWSVVVTPDKSPDSLKIIPWPGMPPDVSPMDAAVVAAATAAVIIIVAAWVSADVRECDTGEAEAVELDVGTEGPEGDGGATAE